MENEQRNIMLLGWITGRIARGLKAEKDIYFRLTESDMHYPFNTFGRAMQAWESSKMPNYADRDLEITTACGYIDSECDAVMRPNAPISQEASGQFAFAWEKGRSSDRTIPEAYK